MDRKKVAGIIKGFSFGIYGRKYRVLVALLCYKNWIQTVPGKG